MKIIAYEVTVYERPNFENFAREYGVEIEYVDGNLNIENVGLSGGCDAVTTLGRSRINKEILDKLKENGVKYVATRTIGYNHIDVKYANEIGIKVCNSNYEPNGVADFTLMLMLMSLRHYKQALWRGNVNDYSLYGLQGKEMKDLTVGVIGTGRIGKTVIKNLTGFGCEIIAYDPYKSDEVKEMARYVNLEEIYENSDIISLHIPLLDNTREMINENSISKMKDGVILINCSRGELMNIKDIIEGVESKKIGAMALDVFENEEGIYHRDRRTDIIKNRYMAYLRQFPNVTMTHHIAFFTDAAVRSMVEYAISGLVEMEKTGTCKTEIK